MRNSVIYLLFCSLCSELSFAYADFPCLFKTETDYGKICVVRIEPLDSGKQITFTMTPPSVNEVSTHQIIVDKTDISGLYGWNQWFYFLAASENFDEVVVISRENPEKVHEFPGFQITPSPDRQRIIYRNFVPRFTPPEIVKEMDYVALLDLSVGAPLRLFPPIDRTDLNKSGYTHANVSPFAWSPEGTQLVFLDVHKTVNTWNDFNYSIVHCAFTKDAIAPVITVQVFPWEQYVKSGTQKKDAKILLGRLTWHDDKTLEAVSDTLHRGAAGESFLEARHFLFGLDGNMIERLPEKN